MSGNTEKTKNLYYRRAIWPSDIEADTLENHIKAAHQKLQTPVDRDFQTTRGDRVQCIDFELPENGGVLLHIGKYAPGEESSTIQQASKNSTKGKTGTQKATAGSEFMDGDIFCYINDNHVCLLPSGTREGTATKYAQKVMERLDKKTEARHLKLIRIARVDILKMLRDEGIKEVSMRVGLYEASQLQINQSSTNSIEKAIAKASEVFGALVYKDQKAHEIRERENLNIEVKLTFDGKTAQRKPEDNYGADGQERLIELAGDVLDDEKAEDFVIVTKKGNTVTSSQIAVREPVGIRKQGKSVVPREAWDALLTYYDKLKNTGVLEQ